MRKIIPLLILSLLVMNIVSAQSIIDGSKVYSNNTNSKLEVWPHTIINPEFNWQYINITIKTENDYKFKMEYYKDIEWIEIQEWKNFTTSYEYCDDDNTNCQTQETETIGWVDVTEDYTKQKDNGKDKIDMKKLRKLNKDENRLLRLRYKPLDADGKWDLFIEDKQKNDELLDPWWSVSEQNSTEGFLYLTNNSFTDRFDSYPYTLLDDFEATTGWSLASDSDTIGLSSDSYESANSIIVTTDLTNSVNQHNVIFKTFGVTDLATDGLSLQLYVNESIIDTNGVRILLYTDFASDEYCNYYTGDFHTNQTVNTGWNKINFDLYDAFACVNIANYNGTIDRIYIYVYNDNTVDYTVQYDNMYLYNTTFNFENNWINLDNSLVNFTVITTDNGFGFDTVSIAAVKDTSVFSSINITEFDYDDFEFIGKFTVEQDLGSEYCAVSMRNADTTRMRSAISSGALLFRDDSNQGFSLGSVTTNDPIWFRIVVNGTFVSHYYSRYSENFGNDWTLAYNYTTALTPDTIKLTMRDGECVVDNIMVRELIPKNFSDTSLTLEPSFIYDSSEDEEWLNATVDWYQDGTKTYTDTYQSPTDFTDFSRGFSIFNSLYANVTVCSTAGCAWNTTQTVTNTYEPITSIYLGGGLLLDTTPSLDCFAVIQLPNASNSNVSVTWFNNSVAFKSATKVCEHNNICTLDTINQSYIPTIDNVSCQINLTINATEFSEESATKQKNGVGECSASLPYPIINFTYFDESTSLPINLTAYYDLTLYDGSGTINVSATYQDNYSDQICTDINPSIATLNIILFNEITLWKTAYSTRILDIPQARGFSASNDPYPTQSLYLIPVNGSSTITFNWLSTDFKPIDGTMLIYKCNTDGSKDLVASTPITTGTATADLIALTQAYSYEAVVDGTIYANSDFNQCHTENTDSRDFYLDLQTVDLLPVSGLLNVNCSIYDSGGNTVTMSWNENEEQATDIEGCIVAFRQGPQGHTEIYRDCLTNPTGSFIRTIPTNQFDYVVRGELTQNGNTAYCGEDLVYTPGSELKDKIGATGPLLIGLMVIGLGLWFADRGFLMNMMAGVSLIVSLIFGFVAGGWPLIMIVLSMIVIVGLVARYTKKREVE